MAPKNNRNYALITGGTEGIGYELAKLFAQDGYNLILVARTENNLQEAAKVLSKEYSVHVLPIAKDLFDPNAPFELYDEVRSNNVKVDVLVNDAGQGQFGLFI